MTDEYVMMYKVKAVCENCGHGDESVIPQGCPLTDVACANCGCTMLRKALPSEAENIASSDEPLKLLKFNVVCDRCKHVHEMFIPEEIPLAKAACIHCKRVGALRKLP